ncbi:B12-binding domain-containing radical SAM protein, partial [Verrucomicrobiota bacterium]
MKIALIQTPYLDVYGPDRVAVANNVPLGIAHLAGYVREHGQTPILLDPEANGWSGERLHQEIRVFKPDLIGLSCVTASFLTAKKMARKLKEEFGVPIAVGGPHASALPDLVIEQDKEFDIVAFGEGEETLAEAAGRLEQGRSLEGCLGCHARENGRIVKNERRPYITDVDSLPYPAYDLLDLDLYRPNNQTSIGKRSLPMFSGRGCPFPCVFCATNKIMGFKFRANSAEYVVNQMQHLIDRYKVEHIAFKDDTFTVNRKRVFEICSLIRERGIRIPWTAHATASTVNEEMIKTMRDAGCFCILYGIESGDPVVMKNMGKGITPEQVRRAIGLSHQYGIKTLTSYIFGLPGERRETVENTIKLACSVPSTISMFFILVPYPGSKVYDDFVRKQPERSVDWKYFAHTSTKPLVSIEGMSEKEMLDLIGAAYRRFYARPT